MHGKAGILGHGALFLLSACGGGGGGSGAPSPAPAPAPPVITGPASALPAATAGSAAPGATVTATGATPITFTISAGSLPDGMTLNANSGAVSGTPLVLGTFNFTVTATNSGGTASAAFSQLVNPATPNANLLLSNNRLVSFNTEVPTALEAPVDIRFLAPGDAVVAIVRRPGNGFLYGFALDAAASGRLYALHPTTGVAVSLGNASGFADSGLNPQPITGPRIGAHVSPAADVLRIANETGQNFRFSMFSANAIDGDLMYVFNQMDAPLNGATTRVDALAYTNNSLLATVSTLYAIDSATDALCTQEPANSGTIGNCLPLSTAVDAVFGFDIAPGVNTLAQGAPVASGSATAVIQLPGETTQRLARIDLTTGTIAANQPIIGTGEIRGLAIQAPQGVPLYALTVNGTQLQVFTSTTPATVLTRNITGVMAGDELMSIDFNPQTGQLIGIAVNPALDTGRVYTIAPQNGGAVPLGAAFTLVDDAGATRDLPLSGPGYGFDFDPTNGRARVVTGTGLNFRIQGGSAVDGNVSVAGVQADPDVSPIPAAVAGLAYTNGMDIGVQVTTAFVVSYTGDELCRLAPDNTGTLVGCVPLLLPGAIIPVPLGSALGFDIPGDVRAPASGDAVIAGTGYLAAYSPSFAATHLLEVNLATGGLVDRGPIGNGANQPRGLAVGLTAVR
jgi:hypothetical protein